MSQQDDRRAALLLMDLQRGIVENYSDPDFLPRIQRAIKAARRVGLPLVWVRVCFRSGYPEISPRNQSFSAIRQTGRFVEGSEQSAIHPALGPEPEDVVVTKRRVGAFSGSDLDVVLRSANIETLVLTGIATSGVVLSTVRLAADLDYRLIVLKDGCTDSDPEIHRVLTEKVFPRQATVQTIDEWIASIAG
ncbi:MAG: isochorismatase family cysteine hydrolase [Gammaproteobacteria bacterium]